jgi:hypothetical protein
VYKTLPPSKEIYGYTIREACDILLLKKSQVYNLCKQYPTVKISRTTYISQNQLQLMLTRRNRYLKEYDI